VDDSALLSTCANCIVIRLRVLEWLIDSILLGIWILGLKINPGCKPAFHGVCGPEASWDWPKTDKLDMDRYAAALTWTYIIERASDPNSTSTMRSILSVSSKPIHTSNPLSRATFTTTKLQHLTFNTTNKPFIMQSQSPPLIEHALIGQSSKLPINTSAPTISIKPITLTSPSRPVPLQLRLTVPATGTSLPIILLSHGHGASNNLSSLNGYAPLAEFWAAHGFAVIQPTHLSSRSLSLPKDTPGAPLFWCERVNDMKTILDQLDEIEKAVPFVEGRLDHDRIAVVGHSLGGHTASVLLGMQLTDPESGETIDLSEPRIKAGVLIAVPGDGGDSLSEWGTQNLPFHRQVSFKEMTTPTLVVVGDDDESAHLTTRGWKWHADSYHLSTGPKSLLTLFGGDHCLGISGYDAAETKNESPERVAAVQRLTAAYLRDALHGEDSVWQSTVDALHAIGSIGEVVSK
jgi:predicted dienelactone hydrolase